MESEGKEMIAQVIVDIKAYAVDRIFDYIIPQHLSISIGMRVKVPFGPREIEGYVIAITDAPQDEKIKLKEIYNVSEIQFLDKELIELAKYVAEKTGSFQTSVLQAMLPKDITKRTVKKEEYITAVYEQRVSDRAKTQKEVLAVLHEEQKPYALKRLRKLFGASLINKMKKDEVFELILQEETAEVVAPMEVKDSNITLREEQIQVITALKHADTKPFLLQGVTGSGKTEVYIQYIAHTITAGKTAMMLVPEIGLTPQMIQRFEQRFSAERIALLHSGLSQAQRYNMWLKIKKGTIDIVLGTRSAIFAPLKNIGVIIIDEEHDASYKQDNMPTYSAIDIAMWRGNYHQATILLASATPSLESFVRAQKGIYTPLYLTERINANPANVEIVDMRQYVGEEKYRYFSKELLDAIAVALEKKEQVMILLNRRGYATVVQCQHCGHTPECPNCDTTLTYHKEGHKLTCHYCQYSEPQTMMCSKCGGKTTMSGVGIQKIVEVLAEIFPSANLMRVDKDMVKKYDDYYIFYEKFLNHEADIMIGTQMITKGFDFPNVTVVGVLETDQLLHMPDLRAREKTYQLLRQVIGRTGRSDKQGTAYLQTYDAEHPIFKDVEQESYETFAIKELEARKEFKNPPYWNVSDIIVSSNFQHEATKCVNFMYNQLKQLEAHATIYPPSATFIGRINNKYYYHIMLKYKDSRKIVRNVQKLLTHVVKNYPKVHSYIQINPINFL